MRQPACTRLLTQECSGLCQRMSCGQANPRGMCRRGITRLPASIKLREQHRQRTSDRGCQRTLWQQPQLQATAWGPGRRTLTPAGPPVLWHLVAKAKHRCSLCSEGHLQLRPAPMWYRMGAQLLAHPQVLANLCLRCLIWVQPLSGRQCPRLHRRLRMASLVPAGVAPSCPVLI